MNDITPRSIVLSNGAVYTPKKGEPPVSPCQSCKYRAGCSLGVSVCDKYMEYEEMTCVYRRTVF